MPQRADVTCGNHLANGETEEPRPHRKRLSIPPDGVRPTCQQE